MSQKFGSSSAWRFWFRVSNVVQVKMTAGSAVIGRPGEAGESASKMAYHVAIGRRSQFLPHRAA